MIKYSICLFVSLFITTLIAPIGLTLSFKAKVRQVSNSIVKGTWTLVGDTNGRTIKFVMEKTLLKGTFVTKDGIEQRISNVRFSRDYLYFKVPDLKLYFEMRLVGDHFEGKISIYDATEKKAPEPVR